jgi:hypothetical protein
MACGESGSSGKVVGAMVDDGGASAGQEAGIPGRRGGGGGAFGGSENDGGAMDAVSPSCTA